MKVYLIWKRGSYCDYDVIKIFSNENKAIEFVEKIEHQHMYSIEEKEIE